MRPLNIFLLVAALGFFVAALIFYYTYTVTHEVKILLYGNAHILISLIIAANVLVSIINDKDK